MNGISFGAKHLNTFLIVGIMQLWMNLFCDLNESFVSIRVTQEKKDPKDWLVIKECKAQLDQK